MNVIVKPVEIYNYSTKEEFLEYVSETRKPLIVKGLSLGPCIEKWSIEYLAETVANIPVTVHVSPTGKMSFLKKNFTYMKLPFNEFLYRASGQKYYKPILCENEILYYRSISFNKRGTEVSDISKHFPQISPDFNIPELFDAQDFFSSVFRIASPNVQVWIHYDIMDNILVQINGSKRVTLFSPSDAGYMYLVGDKSEVIDTDNPDVKRFPLFYKATQYECTLSPGEAIFIPSLWFHKTESKEFSISINVFWKNLPHDLYDKKDVYGNKDLIPATKAFTHLKKVTESLNILPKDYRRFYLQRCIIDLKKCIQEIDTPSEVYNREMDLADEGSNEHFESNYQEDVAHKS